MSVNRKLIVLGCVVLGVAAFNHVAAMERKRDRQAQIAAAEDLWMRQPTTKACLIGALDPHCWRIFPDAESCWRFARIAPATYCPAATNRDVATTPPATAKEMAVR
ncbi:hypothetical protein SAMN05519103_00336 [Rhizobiales bacterium GAS113]|nr:hypothetical protein SAMN05519103_00336 [Rhizobiales bacterium GAS113]